MTKQYRILGPYCADHPGPFCTRDGRGVTIYTHDAPGDWPIHGRVDKSGGPVSWTARGGIYYSNAPDRSDLMCAEEIPERREFWINEYVSHRTAYATQDLADNCDAAFHRLRCIHVREVLPGDEG